jgi:hypothetical protein
MYLVATKLIADDAVDYRANNRAAAIALADFSNVSNIDNLSQVV